MGTLLETPRSPQIHNRTNRPRPVVPIVPVIPRPLNAKRKHQSVAKQPIANGSGIGTSSSNEPPIEGDDGPPLIVNGSAQCSDVKDDPENKGVRKAAEVTGAAVGGAYRVAEAVTEDRTLPSMHNLDHAPPPDRSAYILPPPFYPASHRPAPSSLNPFTFPQRPSQLSEISPYHSDPSNGPIVFGGFSESADSSPGLPLPASTSSYPPQMPPDYAPPPSEQNPNGVGHVHHISDHHPSWFYYPPYATDHQHPNVFSPEKYAYNIFPEYYGQMPSFVQPEDCSPYTPSGSPLSDRNRHGPLLHNPAMSTSSLESQSLSGLLEVHASYPSHHSNSIDPGAYLEHGPQFQKRALSQSAVVLSDSAQVSQLHAGAVVGVDKAVQHHDSADLEGLKNLTAYLLSQFGTQALADYMLQLSHLNGKFEVSELLLHSLLIARSPVLAGLMHLAEIDQTGWKRIIIKTADKFVMPDAFELALQHLYGQPLLDIDGFVDGESPGSSRQHSRFSAVEARINFALAYAAAGHILQISSVKRRGFEIVSRLVNWETIEKALVFAVDGVPEKELSADGPALSSPPAPSATSGRSSAISEMSVSDKEANSTLSASVDGQGEPATAQAASTYGPMASSLFQDIIRYLVSNFPSEFELQTSAPPLTGLDRLPSTAESKTLLPHPRLSFIQFGDRPSEEAQRPSLQSLVLSKILFSVPFLVLRRIFEQLEKDVQARLAQSIIDERERRRHRALRSRSVPWSARMADEAHWNEVGWEESVDTASAEAGIGVRLTRRWTGFYNPSRSKASRA
ncbi:MAG: hypothetical protein M1830_005529 [Pleopsidium flavum]|nr:MAG: hypothetical protein M1830_005529 [Pleopsidium flavum]